jgi:hypothetical protein
MNSAESFSESLVGVSMISKYLLIELSSIREDLLESLTTLDSAISFGVLIHIVIGFTL